MIDTSLSLAVAAYAVPTIIIIEALFLAVIVFMFIQVLPAYKDCFRIKRNVHSPIISFCQETVNGNSVIRAFNMADVSRQRIIGLLQTKVLAESITWGMWSWYSLWCILLSALVLLAGSLSAIWLRASVDPILLALMLQYLLSLQWKCIGCVGSYG